MRSFKFLAGGIVALIGIATAARQTLPLQPPVTTERVEAATPPPPTPAASAQLTAEDVNAWLDGFMPYGLASGDVAGAVVVVVRDGQVLTQRGFGYADVARRIPIDPNRTLFRPGSVAKLFTWTAVMQLVEQGRLDLDADVNRYLDFQIPPRNGRPITLRNIMTHTAGFEENAKWVMSYNPDRAQPYATLLRENMPARVYDPGSTPAYSNYATSLAGYIVERVSGEPFSAYIQRHIFAPLAMNHSSFEQPLPPRLRPLMSAGYPRASVDPKPFEIVGPAPAGALSSTGADMARFMIAHLNQGALGDARILRPETAQMMHNTPLTIVPPLNRMMLGFFETNINNRQVIAHLGDSLAFHTSLHLFMRDNVGLYVSFNSLGREGAAGALRSALFQEFADRYFPAPRDARRVPAATASEHARMMSGIWQNSRRSVTNFLAITGLLGQVKVGPSADGTLSVPIALGLNGAPRQWVEVAPFLWQDQLSHERLAARVVDGRVVRWSIDGISPFMVFDRVPWHQSSAWLLPALYLSLAILLLTALLWPIRALVRRRFGAALALERRELIGYRLARLAALAIVLTLIGWAVVITAMLGSLDNVTSAFDPVIYTIQIISFITFIGGFALILWDAWLVWRGKRRWTAKVWSLALVFAGFITLWIAFFFNLLSLGAHY